MMYGAEIWAAKKAREKKLHVVEMRILIWIVESPSWTELRMRDNERGRDIQETARK